MYCAFNPGGTGYGAKMMYLQSSPEYPFLVIKEIKAMKIKPNPNCKACNGTGEVYDIVDWGAATCSMPTVCDCVIEQLPDDQDEEIEIELDLSDLEGTEGQDRESYSDDQDRENYTV